MSEPIPESVPTSSDPRSKRPIKRQALTPTSQQANQVEALFANPDKDIVIPTNRPKSSLPPPPEIVPNVQGSSAGAGSGEFHVYKASRRREYERLRAMEEEVEEEKEREEFEKEREERRKKDEGKMNKNRAKRDKAKERKKNKGKEPKHGAEKPVASKQDTRDTKAKAASTNAEDESGQPNAQAAGTNPEEIGLVIHDDD